MLPVKVEVPRPETVRRFEVEKEVEEAMGKREASAVEVALKTWVIREPVNTPEPVTESAVPGVPVAMPKNPPAVRRAFSESVCSVTPLAPASEVERIIAPPAAFPVPLPPAMVRDAPILLVPEPDRKSTRL